MDGKTARGASSPANPALHIPDPLSITIAATSSLMFLDENETAAKNQSCAFECWSKMEETTCPSGDLIPIPPYKEILMAGMHSQIWSIQIAPLLNFRKSKVHNSVLLSKQCTFLKTMKCFLQMVIPSSHVKGFLMRNQLLGKM